ncbi:MAG: type II toxin-antitoxin system PemK/MazF family toxin [Nitrococcus sp.]|nr:type II toxin-antitoxin system PemK/MazF family toxin [Nitrococcus sp.]
MGEFAPEIGLVIRHAYLWWNEARAGREEGAKDRPCVIVHTRRNEHGETEVYIAPVTHTPPENPARAMEIPQATKKRLRLDDEKSWIITTEVNRFIWPGPDLRAVPGGGMAYGFLPASMARGLVQQIKNNARSRAFLITGRDDEALNERVRRERASREPKGKDKKKGCES